MSGVIRGRIGRHSRTVYVDYLEPAEEGPCTILLHDGEKRGEFEPWMVETINRAADRAYLSHCEFGGQRGQALFKIAAALSKLWEENDAPT